MHNGRFFMIITVIGGQLYFALAISLLHSQMTLSGEEQGVLNIISNNKKEKQKRRVAATMIYYLMKLAGTKNTELSQGNIFWYKTKRVKQFKFQLYVEVMKFKKIKTELSASYSMN
eukprot:CAMPEP_0170551404 /NCGR_PEP_ID=MMETSP0211-20121228/9396_1 /TAXON_ID=311385 /ORGANISM="Pseudokeronopsis sp., Strain OXSARD2" /LENGTH=115 /DNA_ID=CAMNT_0010858533 /DNA_START=483 /DNA_END=830 /DNA_ORIENTATION=-